MDRFRAILDGFTWRRDEDGQAIHVTPGDPGGATNHGVILLTYATYRARSLGIATTTVADLASATLDQLAACIRTLVWNAVHGDYLPVGVDAVFFDFAFGSGGAIKQVQDVLGVDRDGAVGPQTMRAIASWERLKLVDAITHRRQAYHESLPVYSRFRGGWDRRVRECRLFALGQLPPEAARAPAAAAARRLGPDEVAITADLNAQQLAKHG